MNDVAIAAMLRAAIRDSAPYFEASLVLWFLGSMLVLTGIWSEGRISVGGRRWSIRFLVGLTMVLVALLLASTAVHALLSYPGPCEYCTDDEIAEDMMGLLRLREAATFWVWVSIGLALAGLAVASPRQPESRPRATHA